MRLIGKLLALPFVLVMGILYLVCKFLVVISGAVLGILSGIVFLAALVLFTFPGSPMIYYGDEAGMEGFEDPFCRVCYPWGHEDEELQAYYRMMTALRGSSEALRRGGLRVLAAGNGRIAFTRAFGDESLIVCVNHSIGEWVLPAGRVRFAESAAPSPTGEVVLMRGGFCLLEPSDPEAHISIE